MGEASFAQWLYEGGQVNIPIRLLQKLQILNISPENLGYLVLALARAQENLSSAELTQDRWLTWAVAEGWAVWEGEGGAKKVSFSPLWDRLYSAWQQNKPAPKAGRADFDYVKIVRWLDRVRGSVSTTLQDKQLLQEFNIKYGWSTDFIIAFLELYFEKTNFRGKAYERMAHKVYKQGIDTVAGLIKFMNEQDWTLQKVEEVKEYVGKGAVTLGEKELYLKWQNQWKMSHELILKGAQALTRTNKPSFHYLDKILESWYQQGIKDVAQAEAALSMESNKDGHVPKPAGKNRRFSRADQRDIEKLLGIE